ncbi:MAG: hypothetical protein CMH27_01225 [Micavibrio sp.]|nr:hypothetical protein [Micavibrio sp.]|tara:strand:+ start:3892 stop:5034 length:1143 start_codon:yes stop_codon:yes gene_type:complete
MAQSPIEKDTKNAPQKESETVRELFCEQKYEFLEALECLYITNNQSGRLMFAEKWPDAAAKIFPDGLVHFDHHGIGSDEDREKRAGYEQQADVVRDNLLEIFDDLETRLVVYGTLQVKELDKIMEQIDRPLASYIFSERFVNKYFPQAPSAQDNQGDPGGEDQVSGASQQDTSNPARKEAAPQQSVEAPQNRPKQMVEVPDVQPQNIGHVDHSFSTAAPTYKDSENGDEDEDMSWLDSEEDEFGDVQPISTESVQTGSVPTDQMRNPLPTNAAASSAPETNMPDNQEASGLEGKEKSSDAVSLLQEEKLTAQMPHGDAVENNERNDPMGKQDSADADKDGEDEKKALRVPSLDDLDKHMPGGDNSSNDGFPPIPGSDDRD